MLSVVPMVDLWIKYVRDHFTHIEHDSIKCTWSVFNTPILLVLFYKRSLVLGRAELVVISGRPFDIRKFQSKFVDFEMHNIEAEALFSF